MPITRGELRTRLEAPGRVVRVPDLPSLWRTTTISLSCRRPRGLEEGPWLAGALRGALGQALMSDWRALLAPLEPADHDDVDARALFFDDLARLTGRLAMPKPWLPVVEAQGDSLTLTILLFGFAEAWREEARTALLQAALGGLAITERGSLRVVLEPREGAWSRSQGVPVPEPPERVRLQLLTPLALRAAGPVRADLEEIVFALLDRVSGLARWQGVRLETDWGGWRRLAQALVFERVALSPYEWARHSRRQPGRLIPMRGLMGGFDILHPPPALMPLLALGERCHAGAHATLGMGRFRLLVYPV